jgi:hypothetical protein
MLAFLAISVIIKMAYVGRTEEGCERENKKLVFEFIDCDKVQ